MTIGMDSNSQSQTDDQNDNSNIHFDSFLMTKSSMRAQEIKQKVQAVTACFLLSLITMVRKYRLLF